MIKKIFLPAVIIFFITCLIFFKIFLRGLYPIPGDLLVSFYFPWYSGGWEGYNPWTTHKELLSADSIRQIYVWKEFAAGQFKKGEIPLWNPYTFSGQPLAANFQSSAFYPLNLLYFFTDERNAWILLIVTQPFLGGLFMYLAIRSFKVSRTASIFASIAFMFSSYLITWMENGNIGHSYIWLPLSFYSINSYFQNSKFRYILLLILCLSLSILGGHPQTAIYIYMTIIMYWTYKSHKAGLKILKSLKIIFLIYTASLALSSIQLFPTIDFYKESPISLPFSKEVFDKFVLPYQNLLTFFASDFFGHPAANNFWSFSYGDFTPYFGVIPLIFSLWGAYRRFSDKLTKFILALILFFTLASVSSPISYLIKIFQVPILDSTASARFMSISIFLLIILSAFGFEDFVKNAKNKAYLKIFFKLNIILVMIYVALWVFAIFGTKFLKPPESWQTNLAVTRRNLILPTVSCLLVFFLSFTLIFSKNARNSGKVISILILFIGTLVGGVYFSNKFLPVSPKNFIFPDHVILDWFKTNAGIFRFHGSGTAHIDFNFPTHYQIFGAEGYDTLRFKRYAELLSSGFDGKVPNNYLRSDAVFANEENGYRKRLFELLGVRYLLDKEDNPRSLTDWHYERFPNDSVKGIWQEGKFQIYERENVLPRIFLTNQYKVVRKDEEIISLIYNKEFSLKTLIIEQEPSLKIDSTPEEISIPEIIKYEPNQVEIKTDDSKNNLLFISDVYSKDWQAYIDNEKTPILRTHYALRSVAVPAGNHKISFNYNPRSFYWGRNTSVITAFILLLFAAYAYKNKKI